MPLSDQITVGEHILVLGGTAYLQDCDIFDLNVSTIDNGLGMDIAVLGGVLIMERVAIEQFSVLFGSMIGAGASIFVGGE